MASAITPYNAIIPRYFPRIIYSVFLHRSGILATFVHSITATTMNKTEKQMAQAARRFAERWQGKGRPGVVVIT
jgi:hypothetical protein